MTYDFLIYSAIDLPNTVQVAAYWSLGAMVWNLTFSKRPLAQFFIKKKQSPEHSGYKNSRTVGWMCERQYTQGPVRFKQIKNLLTPQILGEE
jgi:hypothetical protein